MDVHTLLYFVLILISSTKLFRMQLDVLLMVVLVMAAFLDLMLLLYMKPYLLQMSPVVQTTIYNRYPFALLLDLFKLNKALLLPYSTNMFIMVPVKLFT